MKPLFPALLAVALIMPTTAQAGKADGFRVSSGDPYIGAIVVDGATGDVLFEDHADTPACPASIVKLMDLLLVMEGLQKGTLRLGDKVKVTREAAAIGGRQVYLKEGEVFTLDELLHAMSIHSANDAATAVAIHIAGSKTAFVRLMNKKAAQLGMKDTEFNSVHGLPPGQGQNPDVTTARDIARLSLAVVKFPQAFNYTSRKTAKFRNGTMDLTSPNPLLEKFEGCDGLKTGYYRKAGFSISVSAVRNNRRIIAVILGCKSKTTRSAKARELLARGFMTPPPEQRPLPEPVVEQQEDVPEKGSNEKPSKGGWLRLALIIVGGIAVGIVIVTLINRRRFSEFNNYDLPGK